MSRSKKKQLLRKMRNNIILLGMFICLVVLCTHILRNSLMENTNKMGLTLVENYSSAEEGNISTCESILTISVKYVEEREKDGVTLEELREELTSLAKAGYREVVLAGINLSAYGRERGQRLADAIETAAAVPGIQRVRLGSLEPDVIGPGDFARMAATGKVCPQFHLSLQSGCDATLQRMGRRYDTAHYLAAVEEIRRRFPLAAITTDLIVGFPGETGEDFAASAAFARQVGFARIHVFPYSKRPGTRAAQMPDQVPQEEKKRRAAELIALGEELRGNFLARMTGTTQEVLFEEGGPEGQTGYTGNYTPVRVLALERLQGQVRQVRLTGRDGDGCLGELVPEITGSPRR